MNKKIYLIILLAIIITTLSETVSIISGEHGFYQTVQNKCAKCHGDIKVQLSTSVQHSTLSCTSCHITTNHTSTVTMNCRDCHAVPQLNDTREAHTDFNRLGSEGCIACHTTYNAIVNYSRAEYIDYDITNNSGNWAISPIAPSGTLNLSYNAYRNGGNHNWKNVSCQDCHRDIFNAVNLGGHAVVFDGNGSQVPYHSYANYSTFETWCRTCHNTNANAANFSTQHAARRINCEDCHKLIVNHTGNFYTNIQTVPHLYRSLVCIACHQKTGGWVNLSDGQTKHFTVYEEPDYRVVVS